MCNKIIDLYRSEISVYRADPCLAIFELFGIQLTGVQALMFKDMWFNKRVIEVVSRAGGKTFLLGLLATLKSMLYPGYRVALTSAVFRQSKIIFSVVEELYHRVPVLQEVCAKGPVRASSTCYLRFKPVDDVRPSSIETSILKKDSIISFDLVVVDEASTIPKESLKLLDEGDSNLVLMSSGFYRSNYMWTLVKDYWADINNKICWKKVRQVPYQMFPDGYFDRNNISEAQRIMSNVDFRMEYEAAIVDDSEVVDE